MEVSALAQPRKGFRAAEVSLPVGLIQPLLGPTRQPGSTVPLCPAPLAIIPTPESSAGPASTACLPLCNLK